MHEFSHEFPHPPGLIYLNHAAMGPWPARTAAAVCAFAAQNRDAGARFYEQWLETEAALRVQCQRLLNAPASDDIAFLKNTSEALSVVAHGLDWKTGDNVVIGAGEFPSNRIVWRALRDQGVETREVPWATAEKPEDALEASLDAQTRVLAVSSIHFATGMRLDLERLGTACRARDILFCVDAIQSLGAFPLDVQACQADFVMADAHKWLLGPEGCAVFYAREALRDTLRLRQHGWHMVEEPWNFDRTEWQAAASARRFECGSPNMLGIHALHASLALLAEVGEDAVAARVTGHSAHLMTRLAELPGIRMITPRAAGRFGGIVSFAHETIAATALHQRLAAHDIVCAPRAGAVRLSPHFYHAEAQIDAAVDAVRAAIRQA